MITLRGIVYEAPKYYHPGCRVVDVIIQFKLVRSGNCLQV